MSSASAETAPERPPVQVKVEPRQQRGPRRKNNEYIDGIAVDGFEDVKEVFQSNFRDRLEHDGAALAVYHKGKLVVDLWGGWADRENDRNWTRDTIANIFSCTKSVAAICVAMKVDKKECAYTDKVSKCWPEFGRNGKEDITIDMILTHRAGLPYFEEDITLDEAADRVKISKIIEEEIPKFPPGSKIAYHPITFGWLIDQVRIAGRGNGTLFQRFPLYRCFAASTKSSAALANFSVTRFSKNTVCQICTLHTSANIEYSELQTVVDKGRERGAGTLVVCCTEAVGLLGRDAEENRYAVILDTDVYIGSCAEQECRIAKLSLPKRSNAFREHVYDRMIFSLGNLLHTKKPSTSDMRRPQPLVQSIEMFNSPSVRAFGQPAVNGVASARGLALLHQIFMDGTLVSHEFFETVSQPEYEGFFDHTLGVEESKGHGFIYCRSPTGSWQIGHSAMGGQCIRMDPSNELVICYLTNALKAGSGKHTLTYNKLQTKIYEILATKK
ncbi:hypothetical protein Y032_0553g3354 [Ancylostoma ceylanicum]|nr:hypothetical protein Y032_0553g3354 [Ancylostoma ceylanicum]